MIEIVYDEDRSKINEEQRKNYELPKNIRQVGNAPGNYKIYVEDYVMTYLRKVAAPGNMICRGAILLGKVYHQNGEKVLFISGAVDAQNMEFDISMISFNDSVWSSLYSEINKYFDDLTIVGWFLSRMGFSTNINEQMKILHRDNFPGDDKVLFLMDSLECDEAFYYYENGSMVREKGYYIYYVRNEKMQNYIISRKNGEAETNRDAVIIKDKTVVETFREKESKRSKEKDNKKNVWLRTAASVGAVCAVSLGALWYISPSTFDNVKDAVFRRSGGEIQVFMNNTDDANWKMGEKDSITQNGSESKAGNVNEDLKSTEQNTLKLTETVDETSTDMSENSQSSKVDEQNLGTNENVQAGEMSGLLEPGTQSFTYEVEAGDTLVSIAIQMYGDQSRAEYIAEVNGLDMETPIYEGQKIIIPYIQ